LSVLKWSALGVVAAALAGVLGVVLVIRHYQAGLPSVAELKRYHPPEVTRVLARDGTVLASLFVERRTVVPFAEIPQHVKLAFLAAEDASFYEHRGLNYVGMLRALVVNVRAGRTKQGASTITQQVIKNVVLTADRNYQRKIKETILARELEQTLSKDEIFELYLNQIYLGHGRYGVEEASRYYFGKKVRDIDLAEAATLAGLVASPERFSPRHDEARSRERRHYVLDQMLEKGFVTRELHQSAYDAPLRLAPVSDGESDLAPEAVSYALAELPALIGKDTATAPNAAQASSHTGHVVQTSIDPALQAAARKAVRDALDAYAHRQKLEAPFTAETRKLWGKPATVPPKPNKAAVGHVLAVHDDAGSVDIDVGGARCRALLRSEERFNPKHLPPSEFTKVGALLRVVFDTEPVASPDAPPAACHLALGPEAALVALDVRTREIRALIGGYDAIAGGLDRATRARRQPGSAFKPFLYSFALSSRRFTPASVLTLPNVARPGHPAVLTDAGVPAPNRTLSVRNAIAQSDNDAAEFLLKEVGAPNVVTWAHALGIESELEPTPSLALGAYEVTPLELVNAIATFAAGGELEPPKLVTGVEGVDLGAARARVPKHRVMSPEEAYLTTSLLESVVERGTGQRARALKRPVAGKTGTTNGAKDTWFVGYSTDIVAGVWVGYDEPLPLGWGESGAQTALPAWVSFMKVAHEGHPATDFPKPSGIVTVHIDPATGLLAYPGQTDGVDEEFLPGTEPSTVASPDAGAPDESERATLDGGVDDESAEGKTQTSETTAETASGTPRDAGADLGATAVAPF
jgi:penicillin-binding protein 1A